MTPYDAMVMEAYRLVERLGVKPPFGTVPPGESYLLLVPLLHAIVDRLEVQEARHNPEWMRGIDL